MNPIHDRMPVILSADGYDQWLDPSATNAESLQELLQPFPADEMEAFPVSRAVNRAGQDDQSMIEPIYGE